MTYQTSRRLLCGFERMNRSRRNAQSKKEKKLISFCRQTYHDKNDKALGLSLFFKFFFRIFFSSKNLVAAL